MAKFKTNFWTLLSEKEQRENSRYTISSISDATGVSRVTLYKYANEQLDNVNADAMKSIMDFLGLGDEDVASFLVIGINPQPDAQGEYAAAAA